MKRLCLILPILFLLFAETVHCETSNYVVTCKALNVRARPNLNGRIVGTLHKGDPVIVTDMYDSRLAEIRFHSHKRYVSRKYIAFAGRSDEQWSDDLDFDVDTERISSWWTLIKEHFWWGGFLLFIIVFFPIIQKKGQNSNWPYTYMLWTIVSLPFYILNLLQFWLAKPWRPLMKVNLLADKFKKPVRIFLRLLQIPCYVALFPLRFVNAAYYNLIIHNVYEWSNYLLEVIVPSDPKEGARSFWKWLVYLPIRIVKYLLYHGSLTLIESIVWTVVDTIFPAVTLYHGTSETAADNMLCEPKRNTLRQRSSERRTGTWTVGGGNFAGDGIYFGIFRKTLRNYQSGSAIVARITTGRSIDTVLMPDYIYNQAGHANASAVSNWGLRNGYISGEWWRANNCQWWEICMFDRKNRYNDSWRIRPIYVINYGSGIMQRVPGGSAHWLFRKMVIKDIWYSLTHLF